MSNSADNILDQEEVDSQSNNTKWAANLLYLFFLLNLFRVCIVDMFDGSIWIALLSLLVFFIGFIFAIRAYWKKEEKTRSYYFGVYGHFALLVFSLLLLAINRIAMNA